MSLRVCSTPGCPTLVKAGVGRCAVHARIKDKARGTSTQRGYDSAHQREREAWRPKVEAGLVRCRRCDAPIPANDAWDLGHPDMDCPNPKAPEHVACNRATAGR